MKNIWVKIKQLLKKTFLLPMAYSLEQMELLYSLPLRQRLMAVGAYCSFSVAVIVFFNSNFGNATSDAAWIFSYWIYAVLFLGGLLSTLPILYEPIRVLYKKYFIIFVFVSAIIGGFGGGMLSGYSDDNNELESIFAPKQVLRFNIGVIALSLTTFFYGKIAKALIQERQRIKTELSLATEIQQTLLPEVEVHLPWIQLYGKTTPAADLGGDFCDCIIESEHSVVIAIGDVSGHGVAAGLVTAMLKTAIRTELQYNNDLVTIVKHLNTMLRTNVTKGMFVSLQLARFSSDGKCNIINAGHMPIVTKSDTNTRLLIPKGMALGLMKNWHGEIMSIERDHIKQCIFFSDGISEAAKPNTENDFGVQRIEQFLQSANGQSPSELHNSIILAVEEFSGHTPPADDRTLVVVHYT